MGKNKVKSAVKKALAFALVACLGIAGIAAYFTDTDTATNTFTVGEVSLDLIEPNWPDTTPEDITPNEEIAKDPQIKNDGVNDEFVFATVAIPYANVKLAAQNGTVDAEAANHVLYAMLDENGVEGFNDGWILMGYLAEDGSLSANITYQSGGNVVYLFAYGTVDAMTAVAKDETTAPIFNSVRFANVVEDQGLEGETLNIVINAYGIQTTNINDTVGAGNSDGKVAPADVWPVVQNATAEN